MMKKLLFFVFMCFFLMSFTVQAVEVTVTPTHAETYVDELAWYKVNVRNDQARADDFVITVTGPHLEWLNLQIYFVNIDPWSSHEFDLYFYPKEENSYNYEVYAYSARDERNSDSEKISLKVLPERVIYIKGFSAEKDGDKVELNLGVNSKYKELVEIGFDVLDSNGRRVKYLKVEKELLGDQMVTESVGIPDLMAGTYYVRAELIGYDITAETTFQVSPVHEVTKKREVVSNPFSQEVIIIIQNVGNVEEDYVHKEAVPSNEYVIFDEEPTIFYVDDENNMNYQWKIQGLAVGEPVTIKYTISTFHRVVGGVIIVFAIIGILGIGAVRVRRPSIRKKYIRKRNEHLIVLEIKGSLTKELKNVLVKDRVSPLGRVVPQFDGPKPIVRESESGTELIWRLGDIRPRSDMLLTYKIRPLLEAQLKMPRAYLTYRSDDKKVVVYSKQLLLE